MTAFICLADTTEDAAKCAHARVKSGLERSVAVVAVRNELRLALGVSRASVRAAMETMTSELAWEVEAESSAKAEAFREAVQRGLDDIAAGRYVDIPHGEFGHFLRQLRRERKARLRNPTE